MRDCRRIDVFSYEAYIYVFSMVIVARLMCSPVRTGLIKFSYQNILPMKYGTHGSASHLINEKGNEVRDHSSTDGHIIVSTILPTLG